MQKVTKFIYWLLFNSVMFSLASLLLAWISGEDNSLVNWFNGMTLYGTIAAIYLFIAHLIVLILSIIVRAIQEDDTK
jgi:hypothetical protein